MVDGSRDAAWHAATGEIVAFMDDRAVPDRYFCTALARAFVHDGVDVVTGLVLAYELDTYSQLFLERRLAAVRNRFVRRVFSREMPPVADVALLQVGVNMAFRRSTLARLGGFDERLDADAATCMAGDLDLVFRAVDAGSVVLYEPDVLVHHYHPARRDELIEYA